MNCLEFERLLDHCDPAALPAGARAHARACERCTHALARARSLERALVSHFSATLGLGETPPVGLTDRVMARVERGEARGVRWLALPDALPWWVRAAAEPSVALAALLAALLLWRGDALVATARAWAPAASSLPAQLIGLANATGLTDLEQSLARAFIPGPDAHWSIVAAMLVGLAPLLALVGYGLWRASERLVGAAGAAILR